MVPLTEARRLRYQVVETRVGLEFREAYLLEAETISGKAQQLKKDDVATSKTSMKGDNALIAENARIEGFQGHVRNSVTCWQRFVFLNCALTTETEQ